MNAAVGGPTSALQIAVILTLVGLAPAIVLTCTCFARFAIVFSFLKSGLGTQGAPPSQVLVGMSLFMTAFVMAPVATELNERALAPYLAGTIDERAALEAGTPALRKFLLERTKERDLALFYEVADAARPASADDVPLRIAVPAFVLSELRTAFQMGFLMLLPFLVIDLLIATVLSALGMVMLPPAVVALPVKLLVFVAVDGWSLIVRSLLRGAM
jgi:flagellar biosynthesis protein FliP